MFNTRRDFLGLLAAGAAAAPRKKVLVGGHPWVYAKPLPKYDVAPILDLIFADFRYAGLDGIELIYWLLQKESNVGLAAELSAQHKLPIIGMSYQADMWDRAKHNAILDEANAILPRLAKLGGRTMGTGVGTPNRRKTAAEFDAQAEILRKLMALCRSHGVVLNLHNHTYEVVDGEYDLNGTLARIPNAPLGPDIGWLVAAKVDPVDFIRRRGRNIVFAHLRDQKADGTWAEAMGEGVIDHRAIAQALGAARFSGDLVIELAHSQGFQPTRPIRESFKLSRDYIRRVMGF